METTMKSRRYYTIETQDGRENRDYSSFWDWDEVGRVAGSETSAQEVYEEKLKDYTTLRLVCATFEVVKQTRVSPAFFKSLEATLEETENSIREKIIEHLKSLPEPWCSCGIRVDGLVITFIELDPNGGELVGIHYTEGDDPNGFCELSELSTREQLAVLRELVSK